MESPGSQQALPFEVESVALWPHLFQEVDGGRVLPPNIEVVATSPAARHRSMTGRCFLGVYLR